MLCSNLDKLHDYTILKLSNEPAEADFYFVDENGSRTSKETLGASWHKKTGKKRLEYHRLKR